MSRPSIDSMLDHTARLWRKGAVYGVLRARQDVFAPVREIACAVNRPTARLGNDGPGMATIGERDVYTRVDAGLEPQDVIELLTGPEAGLTIEVDEEPTNVRGHHLEAKCRVWKGVLPDLTPGGES